jgi:GGDEF domain-containing protein
VPPDRDEAGDPLIEGIMVDNTKQKRLEEQLRREHRKLRKLSLLDNLTGFFNTRYLYQALDELISASRDSVTPFSLIFMDMDNFKSVVDTHGHLNGSQALREVARTIKSVIKKPSFGVAYGGDEFVLVLPGLDKAQATPSRVHPSRMRHATWGIPPGGEAPQASGLPSRRTRRTALGCWRWPTRPCPGQDRQGLAEQPVAQTLNEIRHGACLIHGSPRCKR